MNIDIYIQLFKDHCNNLDHEEMDGIAEWLEELKHYKEIENSNGRSFLTTDQVHDLCTEAQKKGRADAINAIKNDLHGKLVEEQNKPYPDGSLCLGYYNSIKICDWYLNDNKECEE